MKATLYYAPIRIMAIIAVFLVISACNKRIYQSRGLDSGFSFGVIADCQYCSDEGKGLRMYSMSDTKLQECVAHLNTMDLAYTIHLGDFIDRDWESFDVVNPIYQQLKMPAYHVLGNHDFSVVDSLKNQVRDKLGMPADYYDFSIKNWRFVVLNGNDISFHAYPEASKQNKFARNYFARRRINSPEWNGAIGKEQKKWLKEVLENATLNGEQVMLFCHFPIYPENVHNLWNAKEIVRIIERYPSVKAYVSGHNHEGNYGYRDGIHYLTLKGMVDTEQNAYGVIQVYDDSLKVVGFGREINRSLDLNR